MKSNTPCLASDEFRSAAQGGKLSYEVPSATHLYGRGLPWDTLKYWETITNHVEVVNSEDSYQLTPWTEDLEPHEVVYSWSFTPYWTYIAPAVVYPGLPVTVAQNRKNAHLWWHGTSRY